MILKEFGFKSLPIEFSEKGHRYKLDGFSLRGCTTVIDMKKQDWAMPWSSKEAVKFLGYYDKTINNKKLSDAHKAHFEERLKKKLEEIKELTPSKFFTLLNKAKSARNLKSGPALKSGKITHKLIEISINQNKRFSPYKIVDEDERVEYEIRNSYSAFLKWEKEMKEKGHIIEYLATELVLGNRELFLAGTLDLVARIDGVLYIVDFKTSKHISTDVFLQTAIYQYMISKSGVTEPMKRAVLRLDKGVDGNNMKIENFKTTYEFVTIASDYKKDLRAFLALYDAYKWEAYQKKQNFLNDSYYRKRK